MTFPRHSYIIFGNTLPSFYFHPPSALARLLHPTLSSFASCPPPTLVLPGSHCPCLQLTRGGGEEKIFSSFGYIPECNHTLFTDLPYICSSISPALFSFGEPIMFCDFFKASSLKLNDTLLLDLIYTRAKYPGFIARPGCFDIRFILLITLRNMNLIQNYHR